MSYLYFVEDTCNYDGKYSTYIILQNLDIFIFAAGLGELRKYHVDDLSMLAEAPSISPGYQTHPWGDDNHIYTAEGGVDDTGMVRKYQQVDLALVASQSSHIPGTSPTGLWGDDTYIYESNVGYPNFIFRLLKSNLSYVDSLTVPCERGIWGDSEYIYCASSTTLYKIRLSDFTIIDSVILTGAGLSICGDIQHLYIGIRNGSTKRCYVSKYWKSLEYIASTSGFYTTNYVSSVKVSLTGQDKYLIFSEDNELHLYNADDLSRLGSGAAFNNVYGLCSDNVYGSDYAYVGSGHATGICKYEIMQLQIEMLTKPCTNRTLVSLTANGGILSTGRDDNCSRRGFCYLQGTSGDPTIANSIKYEDGSFGIGDYSLDITGLGSGLPYRVRAYATNSAGVGYGNTVDSAILLFPEDFARVSSIRRVYRPGLYRMELALGDLGFDVDVAEAAVKKVVGEVAEPEVPPEEPTTPAVPSGPPMTQEDWAEIIKQQQASEWYKAMTAPPPTVATKTTAPAQLPTWKPPPTGEAAIVASIKKKTAEWAGKGYQPYDLFTTEEQAYITEHYKPKFEM